MCGFAGYFSKSELNSYNSEEILLKMGLVIKHRGSDDSGIWYKKNSKIGFTHRRLAVQDLSSAGHQPMISCSGRYVIAYNGEIYNHKLLRERVEKYTDTKIHWKGGSDTETLLACIESFGVEDTLRSIVGMFAFSLWDCKDSSLILARDRFGEKPLYYGMQNNTLLFGSDLKSLKQHPSFQGEINRNSIALLMRYGYIPAPSSIYVGIKKLLPGSFIKFDSGASLECFKQYWNFSNIVNDSNINIKSHSQSYEKSVEKLEIVLGDAIERQMIADVPVGAFLSGGIDSSTIVALAQSRRVDPIKTFTIGFDKESYNEAQHAKKVARHIGTEHIEMYVTPEDAIDVIQQIPNIYTEPFADPSQIPTYIVSQMTKKHVTVGLSGDAGDEIFSGYNRYVLTEKYWNKIEKTPYFLRLIMSKGIEKFSPNQINKMFLATQGLFSVKHQQVNIGEKLHKVSIALKAKTSDDLYLSMISRWQNPEDLVLGVGQQDTVVENLTYPEEDNIIHKMMETDMVTYLPDDILCKVDRASMFVGLESRAPFLDDKVVEFAWSLPFEYKIKNGVGKSILRDVLYRHIPKSLVDRPKMGFGVPISDWLRGPLKGWASDLLDENRLNKEGFFNAKLIQEKWLEHQHGVHNWQYQLWPVLMFQLWLENEK